VSTSPPSLRIAVAGAGAIGRRHVDLLRSLDDCEVVGAADPAPAAAAHLQAQGVRAFADVDRMLDETRPQGVVVATPNALHERVAVACLERGIPVLIEKPIAHDLDAARRIAAAAQRTGVAAAVGHHRRHNPLLRAAKAFVESGALGRLVAVSAVDFRRKPDAYYAQAWRREPGGGPLLINGIHDLDCLRWLCGEIETVAAITARQARGFPVEDTAAATLRFANGAIGTLAISDAVQAPWAWEIVSGEEPDYPHEREDCYLVCGTEGALAIPTLAFWRNERGGGRGDPFVRTELHFVPADPWREELRHFAQVVRGEASPVTTVDDATRTLAGAMAIHRSAATGAPVEVASLLR
jgi:predicted dehydrogenase